MKKRVVTIFLFGVVMQVFSLQVSGQYSFQRDYNYFPYSIKMVEALDSGFCIASGLKESTFHVRLFLFKTDKRGEVLWSKKYWNDTLLSYTFPSIRVTNDSGYFINGSAYDTVNLHYHVYCMKADKNGNVIWGKKLGDPLLNEYSTASSVTNDGGFVVIDNAGSYAYSTLFKLSANGNLMWSTNLFDSAYFALTDVVASKSGDVICVGPFFDSLQSNSPSAFVSKFSSDGNLLWCKTYAFDEGFQALAVATAPCGYYISGNWNIQSHPSPILMKIDDDGNFLWAKVFSTSWVSGLCLAVSETFDGGAILMLYAQNFLGENQSVGLAKIDTTGSFQWAHIYGHEYGIDTWSVIPARDNGYMTAGYLDTTGPNLILRLIKSDDMGQTSCNDTAVYLETYDKNCVILSHGYSSTGTPIENLFFHVEDFDLTDSLICIDSFTSVSQTPPFCEISTAIVSPLENRLNIQPNPTTDYFTLTYQTEKEITATLADAFGREVRKFTLYPWFENQTVAVNDLPVGVYLLMLKGSDKQEVWKVVVQR